MKHFIIAFFAMTFLASMHQKAYGQNHPYKQFLITGEQIPEAEVFANDLYFGTADYLQSDIREVYVDSLVNFINYNQQALHLASPVDKQEALTMIIEGKDTIVDMKKGDLQIYAVDPSTHKMVAFEDDWIQIECRIWRSPTSGNWIVLYKRKCLNLVKDMRYPYVEEKQPDPIAKKEPDQQKTPTTTNVIPKQNSDGDIIVNVYNEVPQGATEYKVYNEDCGCSQPVQYIPQQSCYCMPANYCQPSWGFNFSFWYNSQPYYGYYQNPVQGWSNTTNNYYTTYNNTSYTYNIITINNNGTTTTTDGATNGTDGTTTGGNTNGNDGGGFNTGGANTNGNDGYYGAKNDPSSNTNHSKFVPKTPVTTSNVAGSNLQTNGSNSFVPKSPVLINNNSVNTNVVTTGNTGIGYTTIGNAGTTAGNTNNVAHSGQTYNVISPNGNVIATTGGVAAYTTGSLGNNNAGGSTIAYNTNANSEISSGSKPVFYTGSSSQSSIHGSGNTKPIYTNNGNGITTGSNPVIHGKPNQISSGVSNLTHYSNGSDGLGLLAKLENKRPTTNIQQGNYGNGVATNLSSFGNSAHGFSMGNTGGGMISSAGGARGRH